MSYYKPEGKEVERLNDPEAIREALATLMEEAHRAEFDPRAWRYRRDPWRLVIGVNGRDTDPAPVVAEMCEAVDEDGGRLVQVWRGEQSSPAVDGVGWWFTSHPGEIWEDTRQAAHEADQDAPGCLFGELFAFLNGYPLRRSACIWGTTQCGAYVVAVYEDENNPGKLTTRVDTVKKMRGRYFEDWRPFDTIGEALGYCLHVFELTQPQGVA